MVIQYSPKGKIKQIILNKGCEKYIFRYGDGDEKSLLDTLIDYAKNKRTSFDWFDAAVISLELVQDLTEQADGLLKNLQQDYLEI